MASESTRSSVKKDSHRESPPAPDGPKEEVEGGDESIGGLLTQLSDVQVGMKIEAKDAYGKWYMAKVMEVEKDDDEVLVHFERWNSRYDEYVKINSKRLRVLLPERKEALENERKKQKKKFSVGDLVQAKWEDGRMYFGKVLKVYADEVDVLFDDGVQYKAPLSAVRKRNHSSRSNLSRNSLYESDSSQATPNPRTLRAQKRNRSDDSASQASFSSPPSSPVFVPSKKRKAVALDSDSSYFDSELEEGVSSLFQSRDSEEPLGKEASKRELRKKAAKRFRSASSESDVSITQTPSRKKKRENDESRESYQLRKLSQPIPSLREEPEPKQNGCASEDQQPPSNETTQPPPQAVSESVEDSGTKVEASVRIDSVSQGGEGVGVSSSKKEKDMAVASRTRAQTKFENVSRKSETKKQVKVAPKEMVIVWDHNEFKCKVTGCNKSFRKESLLQSHAKHYHNIHKASPKQKSTPGHSGRASHDPGQSGKLSHDKNVKKEPSISPKAPQGDDKERSKSPPPMLSPSLTQPPTKPAKQSPKSSSPKKKDTDMLHKNPNSTTQAKEGPSPHANDGSNREQPMARLETTPKVPHNQSRSKHSLLSKLSKKPSALSITSPPLKTPIVEIKALPRDTLSPRTSSSSLPDEAFASVGGGEAAEVSNESGVAMVIEDGNDVVHCVCGDLTDEGFMIQCEQCLRWQHGDCVNVSKNTLPEKYICCYCTNPLGLRSRYKYQFDRDWFGSGSLPSLPGAPKFPHTSTIKHTHKLTDTLYNLKKMLHSSKVKLQAASRVNHPYLRHWTKECTHIDNSEIILYLISALVPISYLPEHKESTEEQPSPQKTNGTSGDNSTEKEKKEDGVHDTVNENGGGVSYSATNHMQDKDLNVSSLHLDPLPQPNSPVQQTASNGSAVETETNPPDPKTLKLVPLPPLKTGGLKIPTPELLSHLSTSVSSRPSKTTGITTSAGASGTVSVPSHTQKAESKNGLSPKTEPHEVLNSEFGVQELSVFAVSSKAKSSTAHEHTTTSSVITRSPLRTSSPSKLISSARSAFTPVAVPSSLSSSTLHSTSSPLKAAPPKSLSTPTLLKAGPLHVQASPMKEQTDSSVPKLASTMESVSLGEFADAFMQGDTTNWYQRMRLLDHIECVQEKVSSWMDSVEQQLQDQSLGDDTENIEELLEHVQSTMSQLRQIQIANSA